MVYPMEYYSVIKRSELLSHQKAWGELKCMLLSVRNLSEKATYCIIQVTWHSGKEKIKETVNLCLQRVGWGRKWIGKAQGHFRAMKLLCMIL